MIHDKDEKNSILAYFILTNRIPRNSPNSFLFTVLRTWPRYFIQLTIKKGHQPPIAKIQQYRQFSHINSSNLINKSSLLSNPKLQQIANNIPTRSLTKFSLRSGKRKTVKSVIRRFYRLHWGAWIRTKAGRYKRLWKKSPARKRRLRQHVFCNATQSSMLDKMVTKYWKKPKYYIDDPYAPYHSREEWKFSAYKPKPYYPREEN